MARSEMRRVVAESAWLRSTTGVLGAKAFDSRYGEMAGEDDLRIGINSTAILFGEADRAIICVMIALVLFAIWLAMLLDPLVWLYAVAGALLTVTYPWLKRFVHLPQFYLGVAFGWSIPMA